MSTQFNLNENQSEFTSQGKVKVTDLLNRLNEEKKIEKILAETGAPTNSFSIPPYIGIVVFVVLVGRGFFLLFNLKIEDTNLLASTEVLYAVGHFLLGAILIAKTLALILSWPIRQWVSMIYGENGRYLSPPESVFKSAEKLIENGELEAGLSIYLNLVRNYKKDVIRIEFKIDDQKIEIFSKKNEIFYTARSSKVSNCS
mgnify:CR=1 FL=1